MRSRGFQQVLAGPLTVDEDSHAEIVHSLAIAFLGKNDVDQALAILRGQPLQRHTLSDQLASCLHLRGVCEYLAGQRTRAIADLDRLYAMAPERLGSVQQETAAMQEGRFVYELPDGRRLTAVPNLHRTSDRPAP